MKGLLKDLILGNHSKAAAPEIPIIRSVPKNWEAVSKDEHAPDPRRTLPGSNRHILSFKAGDFRVPAEFLKEGTYDPEREIRLDAREILERVAERNPTLPISWLIGLCPEIFRDDVPNASDVKIIFPWRKLLERPDLPEVAQAWRQKRNSIKKESESTPTPPEAAKTENAEEDTGAAPSGSLVLLPRKAKRTLIPGAASDGGSRSELLALLEADRRKHNESLENLKKELDSVLRERDEARAQLANHEASLRDQVAEVEQRASADSAASAAALEAQLQAARAECEALAKTRDAQAEQLIEFEERHRQLIAERSKLDNAQLQFTEHETAFQDQMAELERRLSAEFDSQKKALESRLRAARAECEALARARDAEVDRRKLDEECYEQELAVMPILHQQVCAALKDRDDARVQLAERATVFRNQITDLEQRLSAGFSARQAALESQLEAAEAESQALLKGLDAGAEQLRKTEERHRQEIAALRQEIEMASRSAVDAPVADIVECPEETLIRVELPGIRRENVEVTIGSDATLGVRAMRDPDDDPNQTYHLRESFYGVITRTFSLPEGTRIDAVTADFENGILTLHLPR